jgi:hypothetical protein
MQQSQPIIQSHPIVRPGRLTLRERPCLANNTNTVTSTVAEKGHVKSKLRMRNGNLVNAPSKETLPYVFEERKNTSKPYVQRKSFEK